MIKQTFYLAGWHPWLSPLHVPKPAVHLFSQHRSPKEIVQETSALKVVFT